MSVGKIIRAEDLDSLESWPTPELGEGDTPTKYDDDTTHTPHAHREVMREYPTAEEIEAIQKQAHEEAYKKGYDEGYNKGLTEGTAKGHAEGFEKGYKEGLIKSQDELATKARQLAAILGTLTTPLEELDFTVEQELVSLAMLVARHLVRRELKTDPGHVIAAVRQAVSILPVAARDIRVYLHPEDATLVREALSVKETTSEEERRWRIVEDASLTRGGCNVETESSSIDSTIESRLSAIIAQVMGGERESDPDRN